MFVAVLVSDPRAELFLTDALDDYRKKRFPALQYKVFYHLADYLAMDTPCDLTFLDEGVDHLPLLEAARLLRKQGNGALVLLSSDPEQVYDAFALRAHRFLLKPVVPSAVFEALDAFRRDFDSFRIILAKVGADWRSFHSEDLCAVEAMGHECRLLGTNNITECRSPFQQILRQLPEETFFQVHRSFSVNLQYVEEITENTVELTGGYTIPLSRRRRTEFLNGYFTYLRARVCR